MKAEIIRIDSPDDVEDVVRRAAEIVQGGGIIVYPTDTSYGLGCDPTNPQALERLIAMKQRDQKLGVPLLFDDLSQCETYHEFGSLERVLVRLFWPGALTLIVKARPEVPDHIMVGRDSIAIRVPDHGIPRRIARRIEGPIVGTSANLTGGPSPFEVSVAMEQLGQQVDLYIDAGTSPAAKNSTIVGVEASEESETALNIKIYREGALSVEKLTDSLSVDSDAIRFWTTRFIHTDM